MMGFDNRAWKRVKAGEYSYKNGITVKKEDGMWSIYSQRGFEVTKSTLESVKRYIERYM